MLPDKIGAWLRAAVLSSHWYLSASTILPWNNQIYTHSPPMILTAHLIYLTCVVIPP